MTNTKGRVGHCQRCQFQFVIQDGIKVTRGGRDADDPPKYVCPFCGSDRITIEREANADDDGD